MNTFPKNTNLAIDRSVFDFAGLQYKLDFCPMMGQHCLTLLEGEVEKMRDRMDEYHYEWLTETDDVVIYQINFGDDLDDCLGDGSKEMFTLLENAPTIEGMKDFILSLPYGSEEQIEAENEFYNIIAGVICSADRKKLEDYCMKATFDESLEFALELLN